LGLSQFPLDIASYLAQNPIELQERLHVQWGAEGANPEIFGTKLSGKRAVTRLNPGKIQTFGLDTDGEKFQLLPE
jgi:hypothetical protein